MDCNVGIEFNPTLGVRWALKLFVVCLVIAKIFGFVGWDPNPFNNNVIVLQVSTKV